MCGRFALYADLDTLAQAFDLTADPSLALTTRYNIAPTQQVLGICQDENGSRRLKPLRWGLIPSWAKDAAIGHRLINARCETAHQKPSFLNALRYRRCLIPSNGFFEWKREGKGKQPYFIRRKDQKPLAMAGLWESWKGPDGLIESCTILTTQADDLIAQIHDRMPVMLPPAAYDLWLDPTMTDPFKLRPLFAKDVEEVLEMVPVSTAVNSPRHEGEDCVEPIN